MTSETTVSPTGPPGFSGSLDEFSVDELFELFTSTGATGALVFGEPVGATLWIVDGEITYGTSPGTPSPRELLVRQGIVEEAQYDGAVAATNGHQSLAEALVDLFDVDGERIAAVAREQIITTAFEVVVVGADSFAFHSGEGDPLGVAIRMDHAEVLADADRRRSEWQRIAELIPSTGLIARLSPELPGGKAGLTITADEWQVLAQLDGYRSVADVIAELGQSAFEVCSVLYELLRAGTAMVIGRLDDDQPLDH